MATGRETKACTKGRFDAVVLAASAGGIPAIGAVLAGLRADFPAGILVVQHIDRRYKSYLAQIFDRRTELQVREAAEGDRLAAGTVCLAPPDYHLLVSADCSLSLSHSEPVNFVRPSADMLFKTAAITLGKGVIAVVMTGTGRDGQEGVRAIKAHGGVVIVQDEETAEFHSMPHQAIETGCADYIVSVEEIAELLVELVNEGVGDG